MDLNTIVEKAQGLNDNELAILLCLMSNQHCILTTEVDVLESLTEEVKLISSIVFGLSHATVHCNESTTLDDFRDGLLIDGRPDEEGSSIRAHGGGIESAKSRLGRSSHTLPSFSSTREPGVLDNESRDQRIANLAIVKGLSSASEDVQIQALELLRTRRMFTHTAVYSAPKMFVMVILKTDTDPRLVTHLNDHIFISHYHSKDDGFPNLEETSEWIENDQISLSSVVHRSPGQAYKPNNPPLLRPDEIRMLSEASSKVTVTAEVIAYIYNIIAFLRLHRAVAGGISPKATQMLKLLANCLAPLHGLNFVTPALGLLAARKIYPHRLILAAPENDRSLQYGSDLESVKQLFEGLKPEDVIEEVLEQVEIPV